MEAINQKLGTVEVSSSIETLDLNIYSELQEDHVSDCYDNLGFTKDLEKITTESSFKLAGPEGSGNKYTGNGVHSLENAEDQSNLKANSRDFEGITGCISVINSSLKPFPVKTIRETTPAVLVRNAVKRYGSGPKVLNNFCMTVQKGTIYSLLGSSGCGKTTLLSCVVGLKNTSEGEIEVFGAKPGTRESGIPGKRVGYMPQELALYNDFSIQEFLQYFGTIYGMKPSEIKTSMNVLMDFLDLPDSERRIVTLSGGQKRRVSLAVSLVHSPQLLILDEPTVGVDPLLRESIWSHLCKLVSSQKTTVIITTHYIEEAKQSSMIGLMRGGRLLVEKSPNELLREHNTLLLEDVVLKLCRNDSFENGMEECGSSHANVLQLQDLRTGSKTTESYTNEMKAKGKLNSMSIDDKPDTLNDFRDSVSRLRALVLKNYLVMTRNSLLILFIILIPAINCTLVCLAIGNDPKSLGMGVVNHETNYSEVCLGPNVKFDAGCDVENLSCKFLAKLPADTIYLTEYKSEDIARQAVKDGKVWGFMSFPEGYSENMYTRSSSGSIVDNDTLEGSNIIFEMDLSNKQIALAMKKMFFDGYKDFVRELLIGCGFPPEIGEIPLKYVNPIYGKDDTDFREFIAPSLLMGILFFFPLSSSSVSYIWDKKQGTLDRSLVAGVQSWEIMVGFFITEGCVILIQVALTYILIVSVFGIVIKGSTILFISLSILMGLTGISLGFLISSFCNEEIEAILLSLTAFFPNFTLAGMLWPKQGMPLALQYFSYFLPCTLACESMRSITSRGWGFTHPNVYTGFLTTSAWIIVYWIGTIFMHRVVKGKK